MSGQCTGDFKRGHHGCTRNAPKSASTLDVRALGVTVTKHMRRDSQLKVNYTPVSQRKSKQHAGGRDTHVIARATTLGSR